MRKHTFTFPWEKTKIIFNWYQWMKGRTPTQDEIEYQLILYAISLCNFLPWSNVEFVFNEDYSYTLTFYLKD